MALGVILGNKGVGEGSATVYVKHCYSEDGMHLDRSMRRNKPRITSVRLRARCERILPNLPRIYSMETHLTRWCIKYGGHFKKATGD